MDIDADQVPDALHGLPDFEAELPPLPEHRESESAFVHFTRVVRQPTGVSAEFRQCATATIAPDGATRFAPATTYTVPVSTLPARIARIEEVMIASASRSAWVDGRCAEELIARQSSASPEESARIELFLQVLETSLDAAP